MFSSLPADRPHCQTEGLPPDRREIPGGAQQISQFHKPAGSSGLQVWKAGSAQRTALEWGFAFPDLWSAVYFRLQGMQNVLYQAESRAFLFSAVASRAQSLIRQHLNWLKVRCIKKKINPMIRSVRAPSTQNTCRNNSARS